MKKTKKETKDIQKSFSTSETILLVLMASIVSYFIGHTIISSKKTTTVVRNDPYVQEFADNYKYIIENYYKEVDRQALIDSAISGMLESLDDPYSVYIDETESDNFNITLNGSYKGIGLQIYKDEENGYIFVSSVFKNSPADKAGIIAGYYIVSINNISAKDMDAQGFSSMVRESNETEFNIQILRDNKEQTVTVVRDEVVIDSVISEIYERNGKRVGYIYIGIFANNTYDQFKEKLDSLKDEGIDSIIIDVRDNTGGHLTAVDQILDLFIDSKHTKYQFYQSGLTTKYKGTNKKVDKYNIVLLANQNSASASEVLIAGLKDNLNCKLIGTKTYGKGTVQELVNLKDGNQYKITIKKWLTPNGNWVNDTEGIMPDIELELNDQYYITRSDYDDNQLQTAIDYLTK